MANPLEELLTPGGHEDSSSHNKHSIHRFDWAKVISVEPLIIHIDGDTNPISGEPFTIVNKTTLAIGQKVLIGLIMGKLTIFGVGGGTPIPEPPPAVPTGSMSMFAGSTPPEGYLICQGQAVSRTAYSALFSLIGTTYGVGDGSTSFNVPDMRGNAPVGVSAADTEFNTLGKKYGTKTHTLTTAQMPSHTHTQNAHSHQQTIGWGAGGTGGGYGRTDANSPANWFSNVGSTTATNNNTGSGNAHNNVQPSIALNFIIKT